MTLLVLAGLLLLAIAGLLAPPLLAARKRRQALEKPFPPHWRRILDRRVPLVRRLDRQDRRALESRMRIFLAEKSFVGCDGIEVTDEMRVVIAAQACLLVLRRKAVPYPKLREILVYPGAFAVQAVRPEPSGVLTEERHARSGESWARGQVVLSWDDTLRGAANPGDGVNVVLHEFAHQLDQEKGFANGAPWLGSRHRYPRWKQVLEAEFAWLQQQAAYGQPTLLNHYGATNPAEFFAVATEVFFEQPGAMAALHPALYGELRELYRVDPVAWG